MTQLAWIHEHVQVECAATSEQLSNPAVRPDVGPLSGARTLVSPDSVRKSADGLAHIEHVGSSNERVKDALRVCTGYEVAPETILIVLSAARLLKA